MFYLRLLELRNLTADSKIKQLFPSMLFVQCLLCKVCVGFNIAYSLSTGNAKA